MFRLKLFYCLLVVILLPKLTTETDSFDFTFKATNERNNVLDTLVSGVQLGLRNVMDKFLTSVDIPDMTNSKSDSFRALPEVNLPTIFGGARILPLGCPKCKTIDTTKLFGNWRIIYASDNFIKINMLALSKMSPSRDDPVDPSAAITPKTSTLTDVFMPARFPVCVKLQIGQPLSYGFLMDYPLQFAFKSGTPSGQLHVGYGNLRLFSDGKLVLLAANGAYSIRCMVCIIETNIQGNFPTEPELMEPSNDKFNLTSENGTDTIEIIKRLNNSDTIKIESDNPYFIILSDPSGFPGCQNYVVLVNDELAYMKKYDRYVGEMLRRISADNDANPLQYLGCPCGFTAF